MPSPADVHEIEKHNIDSDDRKDRGYVVMTEIGETQAFGTVAYASTRPTHRIAGAKDVVILGRPDDNPPNGFTDTTFVYPGILYATEASKLGRRYGTLSTSEFESVRDGVPEGIGYRQPSVVARAGASRGEGLRGVVVRFSAEWERQVLFRYGVVLTRHPYGAAAHAFQLVVPFLINPRRVREPNVELPTAVWHQALTLDDGRRVARVVAAVEAISSVKLHRLAGVANATCLAAEVAMIEDGVLRWLGCARVPAAAAPADPAPT